MLASGVPPPKILGPLPRESGPRKRNTKVEGRAARHQKLQVPDTREQTGPEFQMQRAGPGVQKINSHVSPQSPPFSPAPGFFEENLGARTFRSVVDGQLERFVTTGTQFHRSRHSAPRSDRVVTSETTTTDGTSSREAAIK